MKWIRQSGLALTWDERGDCRGVRMTRQGNRWLVLAYWNCEANTADSDISTSLAEGMRKLGGDGVSSVVAGPHECACGFVDLAMPNLDMESLRQAFRFELNKQAPVEEDNLAWGFRSLETTDQQGKKMYRLVYMPLQKWRRMLDIAGAITGGVDTIIPVPAALDPALAGESLFIDSSESEEGYLLVPGERGRELVFGDFSDSSAFGAGDQPLAWPGLDIGELAGLPVSEQRKFAGAIVLALYGTSQSLRADRKAWIQVPGELRPQRHRLARRVAAGLLVYLALILLFVFGRATWRDFHHLQELQAGYEQKQDRITRILRQESLAPFIESFSEELTELDLARPGLLQCLIIITDKMPREYWVSNLNWQQGRIDLQIQSQQDDLGFLDLFRESATLVDVLPTRKTVDHENNVTFQVQMRAAPGRFPIDREQLQ